MKLSELVKKLNNVGASMEAISIAIEAVEAQMALLEAEKETKREKWRKLKAGQRAKKVMSTGLPLDVHEKSTDPSPPDGFLPPPICKHILPPPSFTPSPVKRAQRAARLSEDWKPKEFEGETVELEKFRDWARSAPGQKGVKADWDATWRNWMRRVREQGNVTAFPAKPKHRDLRNIPDSLLSNEDWMRKRMQLKEGYR
jgi:hypothetical protein